MRNRIIPKGFSLLELLLCIALIAVISIFCTPLTLVSYRKNQLEVVKNELITIINFARATAILQRKSLVLAPLPGTFDWSKGAILFLDNKHHQYSKDTLLIHQWQWRHQGLNISWQGFYSDHYLVFSPTLKQSITSGHFIIQDPQKNPIKLILNRLGRVRSE